MPVLYTESLVGFRDSHAWIVQACSVRKGYFFFPLFCHFLSPWTGTSKFVLHIEEIYKCNSKNSLANLAKAAGSLRCGVRNLAPPSCLISTVSIKSLILSLLHAAVTACLVFEDVIKEHLPVLI